MTELINVLLQNIETISVPNYKLMVLNKDGRLLQQHVFYNAYYMDIKNEFHKLCFSTMNTHVILLKNYDGQWIVSDFMDNTGEIIENTENIGGITRLV